ncbi:hypothetical protein GCM10009038_01740 [Salinicola rhizosphaerae]|uniref:Uncharacterized protein n=1 Tax=Salinicola rhizosphaerae TaxID=1443141 RepID=A0ABQ3DSU8_9GAMM|nr:hypothetical protein GCM10009038_01740 [Salinicola rhizosphaerae]
MTALRIDIELQHDFYLPTLRADLFLQTRQFLEVNNPLETFMIGGQPVRLNGRGKSSGQHRRAIIGIRHESVKAVERRYAVADDGARR